MISAILQIVVLLLPVILGAIAQHNVNEQSKQAKHEDNEKLITGDDMVLSIAIDDKLRARQAIASGPKSGEASQRVLSGTAGSNA